MNDTVTDIRPQLAPYLEREQRKNVVQLNHHRREAARSSGVSFGGMSPSPVEEVPVRGLVAAATAAYERDQEWKRSPKGRLSYAIHAIGEAGYQHTAERMRGAYNRSVSMEETPELVGLAFLLSEFAGIPKNDRVLRGPVADGVNAVAELLLGANEQRVA